MPSDRTWIRSRRSFLQLSAAASTVAALRVVTEPTLAVAARAKAAPTGAILIDANENPLGPSQAARDAASAMLPQGGRYLDHLTYELTASFAQMEGLRPDQVKFYAGSSGPLHFAVLAFTSPKASYVTADPGYEAGMYAAENSGARVVKVPLTKAYAHDVKAMLAAAPDAGVFYVCSPNNPTGTLTPHGDIEYLLANKPKGSIVIVDEAYIHFCSAPTALDLVKAGKDVVVLRTFSKLYGMAGLRCGLAAGRKDLLEKMDRVGGWNAMPITAVAAARASLGDAQLVPERRRVNATIRQETFEWLDRGGYSYTPSEANFFQLDTRRPGREVIEAMSRQGVYIGRIWPIMPNHVRVTVGTRDEMLRFQEAFHKVMTGSASVAVPHPAPRARLRHDGAVRVG